MIKNNIAIIGLGYVGLPLEVEFSKKYSVVGFDLNNNRINELNQSKDYTLEVDEKTLSNALDAGIKFTSNLLEISKCNVYIVTVPTPINSNNSPDLSALLSASKLIGKVLKRNDVVIYESTTFPGCTEEVCVPMLELESGMKFNKDFFCGYSPERINPGDKINTITKIIKVTSGSTQETAKFVDSLYSSIIEAGTHLASSIKVAEASKAIENAQRDINISFVNELALIFDRIGIDTKEVLNAASTKWNFLKYTPGLVGGHCISVDPYYLAFKAQQLGYHPEVILSGRKVNDSIAKFIADKVVKLLISRDIKIKQSNTLVLGLTFKENCPDIRNTKVVDILEQLFEYGINVDVYDPWASSDEVMEEFKISLLSEIPIAKYDSVILAVSHKQFINLDIRSFLKSKKLGVVYDIKSFLPLEMVDSRL